MYANDVDVERRRRSVIISIPANDDDGSCGIVDGRLLLLPFMFIEELSMFNYIGRDWKMYRNRYIKAEFFSQCTRHTLIHDALREVK